MLVQFMIEDAVVEGRLFNGTLKSDGEVLRKMVSAAKLPGEEGQASKDWMQAPTFRVRSIGP